MMHRVCVLFAMAAALMILLPEEAQAASFGRGSLPYEQPLAVIRDSVTGPIAFTMSVVGIVIAGIGLIFGGDLGGFIRQMIMLVLAISIVVGATNLMGSLFSQGATVGWLSPARPAGDFGGHGLQQQARQDSDQDRDQDSDLAQGSSRGEPRSALRLELGVFVPGLNFDLKSSLNRAAGLAGQA